MRPIVLDTDVLSFIFKRDTRAEFFLPHTEGRPALISFMTEAELERWALQAGWGDARVARLRHFLKRFLVVPSSEMLGREWAAVMVEARSAGRRIETADAWIAATALLYDAPLATNNQADYRGVQRLRMLSAPTE